MKFLNRHLGVVVAALLTLAAAFFVGCEVTGTVVTSPGTDTQPAVREKMTVDEIEQLTAAKQREYDQRAAEIAEARDRSALAAQAAAEQMARAKTDEEKAAAEKSAIEAAAMRLQVKKQIDQLNADVEAFNQACDVALNQIARKQAQLSAVVQTLGGVIRAASAGATDPVALTGAGVTLATSLLGLGAVTDRVRDRRRAKNPLNDVKEKAA